MNTALECGIFFHNLDLATEDQEFSSLWSRETTTYERGWIDQDDFRLRGVLRYRAEEEDSRTQEVKVSDRTFDPEKDLILEKTETGFRYPSRTRTGIMDSGSRWTKNPVSGSTITFILTMRPERTKKTAKKDGKSTRLS